MPKFLPIDKRENDVGNLSSKGNCLNVKIGETR